jgi:hypothetical protein
VLGAVLLGWDADRLRHGLQGLWDAPYFFPRHYTLAYSEHLLGIAVFVAPIEWLTGNPVLAYNIAYIASFALAGIGMFVLVRALWKRTDAAFLAALAFELTQYRLEETSHIQVLMNGWMPVGLWGLHRYFETRRQRWLGVLAAGFLLSGLSNGYYFYFFLLPILVLVAAELVSPRLPRRRIATDLALTGAAAALVVAPVALAYFHVRTESGFARSTGELENFGARLIDYLHVTPGAWSWAGLLKIGPVERNLFPGSTLILFAALGVIACRSRAVAAYAVMLLVAVWLSMGAHGGPLYAWLFGVIPGFNGLRVPARLASVAVMALAVLAGAGLAWLLARLPARRRAVVMVLVAAVIVLEGQHGVGVVAVPSAAGAKNWDRVAYDWLAASPPGALLELDISARDEFRPETSTLYQLEAIRHHHPMVNGYSGWGSGLQDLLGDPVSPLREPEHVGDVLKGLRAIGVRYVMLHERTFRNTGDAEMLESVIGQSTDQIVEAHRFGDTWAWRLADASRPVPFPDDGLEPMNAQSFRLGASHQEDRLPMAIDGDIDTRWLSGEPQSGKEWVEVRFPQAADVARVQLENAPRSAFDYPRHLAIESVDDAGVSRVLFDGSIVDRLIESTAIDDQRAPVRVDLAPNRTRVLRLRQTGHARTWWSVHELKLWRRLSSSS